MSVQTARPSQTYWASEQKTLAGAVPAQRRMELVKHYGDFSVAYSTAVQPRLEYFGNNSGYIAYRKRWGVVFALGDPVAAIDAQRDLLSDFLNTFRRPSFINVTEPTACHLADLRIRVNELGVDTNLDLADYDFKGKKKEWLRYAHNWIKNRGYQIREATFSQVSPAEVEAVSEAWRKTRTIKTKEVRFLNRPIVLEEEVDVRKWFLFDPDDRMVAFVFFDPIYRNNEVVGYVTCIKRRHPDAPVYAEHAIMKQAIETFTAEGREVVKLGLSPLAQIENKQHRYNRILHYTSRYYHSARWINKHFYSFMGHTQYKRRFRGREEKIYYASPVVLNDYRLLCLASLCGIV